MRKTIKQAAAKEVFANKNISCLFWLRTCFAGDCEYRKAFHLLKCLT